MPQKAEGMRMEPAPSVPTASGPIPEATAAAAPPEEPPEVMAGFHGLRVMPVSGLSVVPLMPNSGVFVLPKSTAPASRSRAVTGASTSQGWSGSTVREPRRVGQPLVRMRSLMETGTPSSTWVCAPDRQRSSDARALSRARSASTRQNAFTTGSTAARRSSTARVASTGEACAVRYRRSSSVAVQSARSVAGLMGRCPGDGGVGLARSRGGVESTRGL